MNRMPSFPDQEALLAALVERVLSDLRNAIDERGAATLVVSGGRTPEALFERLSGEPLNWESVTVTLADERWVPEDSPDSNAGLLRRSLLKGAAAKASLVPLFGGEVTPEEGMRDCQQRLEGLSRPFDLVLLGMGEDGHTASFFPGSEELAEALEPSRDGQLCQAVHAPGVPQARMTLTLPALLDSRGMILLVTGEAKQRVLQEALGDGEVEDMPVRAVLRQKKTPLEVYWSP